MKSIITGIIAVFLTLNGAAQDKNHAENREKRDLKDFNAISASVHANIYLRQADTFSVFVQGDDSQLERLETYVKDSVLRIRKEHDFEFFNDLEKVKIYISAPSYQRLNLSGAGKIVSENKLTGAYLKIQHSGAHNVNLEVDYDQIDANMSGVGNIYLKGKAQKADMDMSGTGSIDAYDLKVQDVDCLVSGLGSILCFAENDLKALVSGMGSVKYKGSPKQVKKKVSGLGKVASY